MALVESSHIPPSSQSHHYNDASPLLPSPSSSSSSTSSATTTESCEADEGDDGGGDASGDGNPPRSRFFLDNSELKPASVLVHSKKSLTAGRHRHIHWSCAEAQQIPPASFISSSATSSSPDASVDGACNDSGLDTVGGNQEAGDYEAMTGEDRLILVEKVMLESSSSTDDSGCESDQASVGGGSGGGTGGGGVDSVYSTVTSCGSELALLQMQQLQADEVSEVDNGEVSNIQCIGPDVHHDDELDDEETCSAVTRLLVQAAVHNININSCSNNNGEGDSQEIEPEQHQPCGVSEEFRSRSWSLDPQLHVRSNATDDASIGAADDLQVASSGSSTAVASSLRQARSEPSLSTSASLASMPICRICHQPASTGGGGVSGCGSDTTDGGGVGELISPCRCAGTMRYIHAACLMRWIEVSARRQKRPAVCELCQFQYQRHKRFRVAGHWLTPRTSMRDKWLHVLFVLMLVVMIVSGVVTVFCFKQDSGKRRTALTATELTSNEVMTLVCGVLFFGAFFVAMYAEVKARHSLYELVSRFVRMNQQWYIDQYDREKDDKFRTTSSTSGNSTSTARCAQRV